MIPRSRSSRLLAKPNHEEKHWHRSSLSLRAAEKVSRILDCAESFGKTRYATLWVHEGQETRGMQRLYGFRVILHGYRRKEVAKARARGRTRWAALSGKCHRRSRQKDGGGVLPEMDDRAKRRHRRRSRCMSANSNGRWTKKAGDERAGVGCACALRGRHHPGEEGTTKQEAS
jgi:hypothetical protein